MITVSTYRNGAAAIALAGGLALSGLMLTATEAAHPDPVGPVSISLLGQATPAVTTPDAACDTPDADGGDREDGPDANDQGDDQGDEPGDEQGDEQGDGQGDDQEVDATPGALTEGADLLDQSSISLDEAIQAAQHATDGDLGPVELEETDGLLAFSVEIGEQLVVVNAADGSVIRVEPGDTESDNGAGCADDEGEDDANATPGELVDGQDLVAEATITVEQAVTIAQGVGSGETGAVSLEYQGSDLVYTVDIGGQEITVDATTGAVLPGDDGAE